MKKYRIIGVIMLLNLFSSCTEDFLEKVPLNYIDEKNFWQTKEHALQGVNAVYAALQPDNAFGAYVLMDMYSPIADETNGGEINLGLHTSRGGLFSGKWTALYLGINRANVALEKIDKIEMEEELKKRLLAECKFLRALFYFHLTDLFGDVPLYSEEITVQNATKERTSITEVRSFILKDLDDAISSLNISNGTADLGRATKGAAIALKGKVYLYAGDFINARITLEELVKNRSTYNYSLLDDYSQVFNYHNKNNSEIVFAIQYLGPKMGEGSHLDLLLGNLSSNGTGSQNTSCPTVELLNSYLYLDGLPSESSTLYDPSDPYANRDKRMDITIIRPGSQYKGLDYVFPLQAGDFVKGRTRTGLMWRKYVVEDEGSAWSDDSQNYNLIRFSDVLLMYAEAKNEELTTPDIDIYEAFNEVRARAGIAAIEINSKTKEEMRQLIRDERKVEFAGEGLYYSDIRRWRIAGEELNNREFINLLGEVYEVRIFDETKHYLWPIPQSEIDMNKSLTQNPNF